MNVLGFAKFGGDRNSFAATGYFVLFAAVVALAQAIRAPRRELQLASQSLLLAAAFVLTLALGLQSLHYRLPLSNPFDNEQEKAVQLMRERPGQIYFPMHPLAGLVAEGQLYHLDEAVHERVLANRGPGEAHYRAHLPRGMEFLALSSVGEYHTKTLPEFAGSAVRTPFGPFTLVGKSPAKTSPAPSSRP
jgi:hypothetical protein